MVTRDFSVSRNSGHALLIRKNRPEWMAGKLNGLGGHIEQTDRLLVDAMVREFAEESRIQTDPAAWRRLGQMDCTDNAIITVYYSIFPGDGPDLASAACSITDETVVVVQPSAFDLGSVLPSARFFLHMISALMAYEQSVGRSEVGESITAWHASSFMPAPTRPNQP